VDANKKGHCYPRKWYADKENSAIQEEFNG
jgi:hypothetical protein